jgi:hypothetical protein
MLTIDVAKAVHADKYPSSRHQHRVPRRRTWSLLFARLAELLQVRARRVTDLEHVPVVEAVPDVQAATGSSTSESPSAEAA